MVGSESAIQEVQRTGIGSDRPSIKMGLVFRKGTGFEGHVGILQVRRRSTTGGIRKVIRKDTVEEGGIAVVKVDSGSPLKRSV